MKNVTILRFLTVRRLRVSPPLAALDLAGVASVFEPSTAKYLLAAGPAALAVKELVVRARRSAFDDGKPNKSFKVGVLCFALAIAVAVPFLASAPRRQPVTGDVHQQGRPHQGPSGRPL